MGTAPAAGSGETVPGALTEHGIIRKRDRDDGFPSWIMGMLAKYGSNGTDEASNVAADSAPSRPLVRLPTQYLKQDSLDAQQISMRKPVDRRALLPLQAPRDAGKPTLVLDLDETLVHCSFERKPDAECVLPVVVDGQHHAVYACIRPGARELLRWAASRFEVIVYTASLRVYARAIVQYLDIGSVVRHLLCRDACFTAPRPPPGPPSPASPPPTPPSGTAVKDLALLQRPLEGVLLVDNSPQAAALQPTNAVIVESYYGSEEDRELYR
ncbi:HAD-like domain-containing protein [Tribonema minus]|uniref:Mitochondrial import inner membrane translocase subunit TIM50 n=1 Tax=Tribonema minus TaxID=303371 RepID=A0A836CD28_9STRA|nr:HAD-like domain-containing protein [Tribonema minus]